MAKKEERLSKQQMDFVTYLVEGDTQRKAYRKAYPKNKGKDKTIDEKASRLFSMDKVRTRYQALMAEVTSRCEEKAIVTREEVIQGIVEIAFPDKYGKEEVTEPNRLKALEMLGRHLGMFTEKIAMTVDKPIIIDDVTSDE